MYVRVELIYFVLRSPDFNLVRLGTRFLYRTGTRRISNFSRRAWAAGYFSLHEMHALNTYSFFLSVFLARSAQVIVSTSFYTKKKSERANTHKKNHSRDRSLCAVSVQHAHVGASYISLSLPGFVCFFYICLIFHRNAECEQNDLFWKEINWQCHESHRFERNFF